VKLTWEDAPLRIDDRSFEPPKKAAAVKVGLEDNSLDVLCPDT
jgi:hypothetical protein